MADRIAIVDGVEHHFPSDATDAEISAALNSDPALKKAYAGTPIPGRGTPVETGGPTADSPVMAGVKDMLRPLAHPQTAGAVAGLLIPSGAGGAMADALKPAAAAVSKYGGAAAKVVGTAATSLMPSAMVTPLRGALRVLGELKPSEWNSPLTVAGREGRAATAARSFNDLPLAEQMKQLPTEGASPVTARVQTPPYQGRAATAAPPAASAPQADPLTSVRTANGDQFTLGDESRKLMQGRLQMAPPGDVAAAPHPLKTPRVNVGAEVVGRQSGLGTQAVREATGPVLGEAPGEASPILPQQALGRIVDTIKALPPGAEREAYVARATSGKAQWQIENIRRTLEHLGLVVPVAASVPTLRDAVLSRLNGQSAQGTR